MLCNKTSCVLSILRPKNSYFKVRGKKMSTKRGLAPTNPFLDMLESSEDEDKIYRQVCIKPRMLCSFLSPQKIFVLTLPLLFVLNLGVAAVDSFSSSQRRRHGPSSAACVQNQKIFLSLGTVRIVDD